jgi:hypothetical protein
MGRFGDGGEVNDQPTLKRADLLVDGGKHVTGHQELAKVGGGSPGLQRVERLVGQLDLTAAELTQQRFGRAGLAFAGVEPVQDRQWTVRAEERRR